MLLISRSLHLLRALGHLRPFKRCLGTFVLGFPTTLVAFYWCCADTSVVNDPSAEVEAEGDYLYERHAEVSAKSRSRALSG